MAYIFTVALDNEVPLITRAQMYRSIVV